ncbi:hypothetical protein NLI96_g11375 [Meripilus lineatus]|uniref:Tetracycline-efflux transporter n=1 Tax=Meripilus lineatus TaxID=2056292 RepID=A0AAD5URW3_9APHY|nr:hypothetical protein NLI96_g11375 [Physisporinus lineatus]
MSVPPPLNVYVPTDPVVSSNFAPLSPSHSRSGQRTPLPSMLRSSSPPARLGHVPSETDALLGRAKKPFYRPRPMCSHLGYLRAMFLSVPNNGLMHFVNYRLVPFVIIASLVRGMTLAPRVQVFTQLSCNAIYGHDVYNHTNSPFFPDHINTDSLVLQNPHSPYKSVSDDDDDNETDPRSLPSTRCLSDPAVQAGAAKIQTIMTTIMGTLSALTTAWWGHFGQRYGRMRVLAISTLGLFLTSVPSLPYQYRTYPYSLPPPFSDITFILVSTPHSIFAAHGHKLLVISPVIEGLLGGWSTLQAATSAYISDCTSDGSRAHIFSRFAGVFYIGFSLGPTIGAYLIRHPFLSPPAGSNIHNGVTTVTSLFYVAAMSSFLNLLLVLFLFPESLDKKLKLQHPDQHPPQQSNPPQGIWVRCFGPLRLLLPKKIHFPEGGHYRDWSLTFLASALFGHLLSSGIFQIKYLYAEHIYGWGAEQLSYYISFVGAVRAVHLLLIMPFLIKTFKPKPKPKSVAHSVTPASSLVTRSSPLNVPPAPPSKPKPTSHHLAKEMSFDLLVLRISLIIDVISHTLVSILSPAASQAFFVGYTSLSSLGAGAVPAVNSFALCAMQMRSHGANHSDDDGGAGGIFGALALVQSVGQQILGPLVFGVVYSSTVARFPKAIFTTAAAILVVSLAFLCFLRPDASLRARKKLRKHTRSRDDSEVERGRSRVSKEIGPGRYTGLLPQASASSSSGTSSS